VKIAFVHQPIGILRAPATTGSLEIWLFEIARRLAKSHEVLVYSRKARDQDDVEFYENVHCRRISTPYDDRLLGAFERHPKLHRLPGFHNPKRPLFASRLAYLEYSVRVARDLSRQRCDVVHISNFSQMVPIVRAFNRRAKIILHMQCEWLNQLDSRMIESRLRECDLVVGCSDYITDKIRRAFPGFANRCRTIYNGVDVDRFVPAAGDGSNKVTKQLLFVGRIWPDKGPHILVEAFNQVVEQHPEARLEFVGWKAGPPPEYILRLSEDQHVRDLAPLSNANYFCYLQRLASPEAGARTIFFDALPHPQLAERYRGAAIFVFPSVWNEPFGIPLIEAMAAGIPVVATRGGGFPEIVEHGKTGLLVRRGEAAELAEAIMRLLKDGDLRRSMGAAGRQRVLERFSWERIATALSERHHEITEGHQRVPEAEGGTCDRNSRRALA
jgi:glycosyltransferase involved in cell wall biosynthesis